MAKLFCPCGHVFSNVGSPNDAMHVVRDRDMCSYSHHTWRTQQICEVERGGMLPDRGTEASELFHESLYASRDLEGELWECPQCGRLLFRRPGEESFRAFREDAGGLPPKDRS